MSETTHGGLHGFSSWVAFFKATISLGLMLSTGLYFILTVALDGRYASADLEEQVQQNGTVAAAVQRDVKDLKTVILQEQIFEIRVRGCAATGDTRRWYAKRLQDLLRQYEAVTGEDANVPECRDVQ